MISITDVYIKYLQYWVLNVSSQECHEFLRDNREILVCRYVVSLAIRNAFATNRVPLEYDIYVETFKNAEFEIYLYE